MSFTYRRSSGSRIAIVVGASVLISVLRVGLPTALYATITPDSAVRWLEVTKHVSRRDAVLLLMQARSEDDPAIKGKIDPVEIDAFIAREMKVRWTLSLTAFCGLLCVLAARRHPYFVGRHRQWIATLCAISVLSGSLAALTGWTPEVAVALLLAAGLYVVNLGARSGVRRFTRTPTMEAHQKVAVVAASVLLVVSFLPLCSAAYYNTLQHLFSTKVIILWELPVFAAAVPAILVVAAFWAKHRPNRE